MTAEAWYSHNNAWHLSRDVMSLTVCKDSHVLEKKQQCYLISVAVR